MLEVNHKTIDSINEKIMRVSKAKRMIEYYSQFKLKPLQLRLIDLVIACIDPESDKMHQVSFPTDVLCKHLGMVTNKAAKVKQYHMNKKVKDLCLSLMGTDQRTTSSSLTVTQKPWFDVFHMEHNNTVTITLCSKLCEFLLINKSMGNPFHTYTLDCVNSLNHREAILLYMQLHAAFKCDEGHATYSIEELKKNLCLEPNEHHKKSKNNLGKDVFSDGLGNVINKSSLSITRNFKHLVIGHAIELINENTNIYVEATMIPEGVPDTRKTHIKFKVTENTKFKGATEITAKTRKASEFVKNDDGQRNAITNLEKQELDNLKSVILDMFKAEGTRYIAIIEQFYPSKFTIEEVCLRCNWLIELKRFYDQNGSVILCETLKLNDIRPGLFQRAFGKKTDSQLSNEIISLKSYSPDKTASNRPTSKPKTTHAETPVNIKPIVDKVFKKVLMEYLQSSDTKFEALEAKLDALITNSSEFTKKTIHEIQFMKAVHKGKANYAWLMLTQDSESNKDSIIPSIDSITSLMNSEFGSASTNPNGTVARRVQEKVSEMIKYNTQKAVSQAAYI